MNTPRNSEAVNFLVIISDEHRRDAMGCMGHPFVLTPNLDALAGRGTLFTNAYTASPMCVPTRAALACGQHVHQTGFWDSATPYDGSVSSWMHALQGGGMQTASIGKLHYRSGEDDNGFDEEILPMHVVGGVGWAIGLLRDDPPPYDVVDELAAQAGSGDSSYTEYDRAITDAAVHWIKDKAHQNNRDGKDKGWAAFVSLVSPHYPLTAPKDFYDLYADIDFDLEVQPQPSHPEIANIAKFFDYDRHFTPQSRRDALAAYYGLTSFMDDCVGQILAALEKSGQDKNTVVIYLSDHGEMLGEKGLWTKQVMYEASVGIPLIAAGPGLPSGSVCSSGAMLVDIAATASETMLGDPGKYSDAGACSLRVLANNADESDRTIFAEYHDGGSSTGAFMVRWQNWKYVYYAGLPPQLFDLDNDPDETNDLAASADARAQKARDEGVRRLLEICDPEEVNERCFAGQKARIAELGGRTACQNAYLFNHTPTPCEQALIIAANKDVDQQ